MKPALALPLALAGALSLSASVALATALQPPMAPPGVTAASSPRERSGRIGAQFDLLPFGTFEASDDQSSVEEDAATAFAFGARIDLDLHRHFTLGIAPRLALGLKWEDGPMTMKELDLRVRASLRHPVGETAEIFAFLAPGFSFLVIPDEETAYGPVVAFGAGGTFDVSPNMYVSAELGYQLAFHSFTAEDGDEVDVSFDMLHIGIGAGTRF